MNHVILGRGLSWLSTTSSLLLLSVMFNILTSLFVVVLPSLNRFLLLHSILSCDYFHSLGMMNSENFNRLLLILNISFFAVFFFFFLCCPKRNSNPHFFYIENLVYILQFLSSMSSKRFVVNESSDLTV